MQRAATAQVFYKIRSFWSRLIGNEPNFVLTLSVVTCYSKMDATPSQVDLLIVDLHLWFPASLRKLGRQKITQERNPTTTPG